MDNFTTPPQQAILKCTGGRLGIVTVLGVEETHIPSALAAKVIQNGVLYFPVRSA
jgi:hypothetical protein